MACLQWVPAFHPRMMLKPPLERKTSCLLVLLAQVELPSVSQSYSCAHPVDITLCMSDLNRIFRILLMAAALFLLCSAVP